MSDNLFFYDAYDWKMPCIILQNLLQNTKASLSSGIKTNKLNSEW